MSPAPKQRPGAKPGKKRPAKTASQPSKSAAVRKPKPRGPASQPNERRLRRRLVRGLRVCVACVLLFFLVTLIWVGTLRFVNPPITGLMLLRHFGEGQPIDKTWRDYEDISPELLLAVLTSEDQRFYEHYGFDWREIRNAIEERTADGRMRGASTLSQQTAKNVFLWPSRSWLRKGAEVYFTLLIEALWPKQRILEVYVNVAETGPGMYGLESAAQKYFGVPASKVTREQAALLASMLPSPLTSDPHAPTTAMKERQAWILTQMDRLGGVRFLQ